MIAPSDARAIYLDAVSRGEKLPVAYVVGSHPCDFMAAVSMNPPMDELEVLGALRGAPVPIVKCVTNDIYVPADAEYVLEGYLDDKGHVEPEGPYGEYVGYYGVVKRTRCSISPRSRTARMRCSRPSPSAASIAGAHRHRAAHHGEDGDRRPGPGSSPRCASRSRCSPRRRAAACTTCASRCASACRAKRATPSPRCSAAWPTPSRCSCSTTTSTCSPTSNATGRWRRATRATATPSRQRLPRGAARSVARRRSAPAPRSASTAPSRSASASRSNGAFRCRR